MTAEGRPSVDFIPALLRRRLSQLSRAALWAAHQCAKGDFSLRTVFASPHGEIERTTELLAELAAANPLSPNAFSLSVHNTAAGLYSIATGNRAASTAIGAGADTLPLALVEAAGQIQQHRQPVLVVFSDMPLPHSYSTWGDNDAVPVGLALLLGPAAAEPTLQLGYATTSYATPPAGAAASASACLGLLRVLGGGLRDIAVRGERGSWRWSCA